MFKLLRHALCLIYPHLRLNMT